MGFALCALRPEAIHCFWNISTVLNLFSSSEYQRTSEPANTWLPSITMSMKHHRSFALWARWKCLRYLERLSFVAQENNLLCHQMEFIDARPNHHWHKHLAARTSPWLQIGTVWLRVTGEWEGRWNRKKARSSSTSHFLLQRERTLCLQMDLENGPVAVF